MHEPSLSPVLQLPLDWFSISVQDCTPSVFFSILWLSRPVHYRYWLLWWYRSENDVISIILLFPKLPIFRDLYPVWISLIPNRLRHTPPFLAGGFVNYRREHISRGPNIKPESVPYSPAGRQQVLYIVPPRGQLHKQRHLPTLYSWYVDCPLI